MTTDHPKGNKFYTCLDNHPKSVLPCPICGSQSELWEFLESDDSASKLVCCSNTDPIGPQNNISAGCPFFIPPGEFYRATRQEAVDYWNKFSMALELLRKTNMSN